MQPLLPLEVRPLQQRLLRVEAAPDERFVARETRDRVQRVSRCRREVMRLTDALLLQCSVSEPSVTMALRHSCRTRRLPKELHALRRLAAACVLIVGSRQGLGLTLGETAAQAGLRVGELKRTVWKVCKVGGMRLQRGETNAKALLQRISEKLQLNRQRGAICDAALKLLHVGERGWLNEGRHWAGTVAAALVLAAQVYLTPVNTAGLARMLAIYEGTLNARLNELRRLLVALLRPLPWGDVVTLHSIHSYTLFALDHYEVIETALPELRRRKREANTVRPFASHMTDPDGTAPHQHLAGVTAGRAERPGG